MQHGRRLMVAAAEAQERPKAAPQVGPQPLTPLAQVASETANHPFSPLFKIIAAAVKVRRHCLAGARRLLLAAFALKRAAAAAASFPTPFPLLCGCHHCVQGCRKSVQVTLQAWRAGPVSRVSKFELEKLERHARHRAVMEEIEVGKQQDKLFAEKLRMEREELARLRQLVGKQPKTADPSAQPPKKAAGPRPAPVEWPPVSADAVPATLSTRQAAAEAAAAAAAAWAATAAVREAAAEAAAERAASQPAGQHTAAAEEWEWAAAAWHAAHQALEAARQACPGASVVREAEAAVQAARALKAQRQGWRSS